MRRKETMKTLTYEELQCKANAIEDMEKGQEGNAYVFRQELAEDLVRLGLTRVWQMDAVKLARFVKKDYLDHLQNDKKA
jgi:hypothetical protein